MLHTLQELLVINVTCTAALIVLLIVCRTLYFIGLFLFGHRALFVRTLCCTHQQSYS